jgi:transposase
VSSAASVFSCDLCYTVEVLRVTAVFAYPWAMNVSAVAKVLGVSRSHVYRLIDRGDLTPYRNPLYRKHAPVSIDPAQVDELVRRAREENGWRRDEYEEERAARRVAS